MNTLSFEPAKALPPYNETYFPTEVVEKWLEGFEVSAQQVAVCAGMLGDAADEYTSLHAVILEGPEPAAIKTALGKISRGASDIVDGFATLGRAGVRHGQSDSEYGDLSRSSAEHLGRIFIGQLVDLFPDRGLRNNPALALLAPDFATHGDRVVVRNALSPAFFRLAEQANLLRDRPIPPSVPINLQAEAKFVRSLGEIWLTTTGRPPSVTKNARYRSPFHSFVATVVGHLAGLRVSTWSFEYGQRKLGLSEQPNAEALIAQDEALAQFTAMIWREERSVIPSAKSIERWLSGGSLGSSDPSPTRGA